MHFQNIIVGAASVDIQLYRYRRSIKFDIGQIIERQTSQTDPGGFWESNPVKQFFHN